MGGDVVGGAVVGGAVVGGTVVTGDVVEGDVAGGVDPWGTNVAVKGVWLPVGMTTGTPSTWRFAGAPIRTETVPVASIVCA